MAYLLASGEWRCEGWTYRDRDTEKEWKRLDCFHASANFLFIAILVGLCCFSPTVFVPGFCPSFEFELVVTCHALVSLACLFEGRET